MDKNESLEFELLESARNYDQSALADIYDRFSPGLYRYAMRLLGDQQLAEECVAETFYRFLLALQKRKGPRQHLQAYLYRTAHNYIVDHYRRKPREDTLHPTTPSPETGPEEQAFHSLRQSRLRRALSKLTPDQQKVIALKFLEGWENTEVARMLEKPVGAVKALQHRALASLKRILLEDDILE